MPVSSVAVDLSGHREPLGVCFALSLSVAGLSMSWWKWCALMREVPCPLTSGNCFACIVLELFHYWLPHIRKGLVQTTSEALGSCSFAQVGKPCWIHYLYLCWSSGCFSSPKSSWCAICMHGLYLQMGVVLLHNYDSEFFCHCVSSVTLEFHFIIVCILIRIYLVFSMGL